MRKFALLAILVMCCSVAQAAITVNLLATTQLPAGTWLWSYQATLSADSRLEAGTEPNDDYFTIYDFDGYIDGSISTALALNPGWVGTVDLDARDVPGTAPGTGIYPDDSLSIINLIFTYTGTTIEGAPGLGADLGIFSAESQFGPGLNPNLSTYVAQTTNNTGDPNVDGNNQGHIDTVSTPRSPGDVVIPEPTTMALMGSALLGLGLLSYRRR